MFDFLGKGEPTSPSSSKIFSGQSETMTALSRVPKEGGVLGEQSNQMQIGVPSTAVGFFERKSLEQVLPQKHGFDNQKVGRLPFSTFSEQDSFYLVQKGEVPSLTQVKRGGYPQDAEKLLLLEDFQRYADAWNAYENRGEKKSRISLFAIINDFILHKKNLEECYQKLLAHFASPKLSFHYSAKLAQLGSYLNQESFLSEIYLLVTQTQGVVKQLMLEGKLEEASAKMEQFLQRLYFDPEFRDNPDLKGNHACYSLLSVEVPPSLLLKLEKPLVIPEEGLFCAGEKLRGELTEELQNIFVEFFKKNKSKKYNFNEIKIDFGRANFYIDRENSEKVELIDREVFSKQDDTLMNHREEGCQRLKKYLEDEIGHAVRVIDPYLNSLARVMNQTVFSLPEAVLMAPFYDFMGWPSPRSYTHNGLKYFKFINEEKVDGVEGSSQIDYYLKRVVDSERGLSRGFILEAMQEAHKMVEGTDHPKEGHTGKIGDRRGLDFTTAFNTQFLVNSNFQSEETIDLTNLPWHVEVCAFQFHYRLEVPDG